MEPRHLPTLTDAASAARDFLPAPEHSAARRELRQALNRLRDEQVFGADTELRFGFDRQTQRIVVSLLDTASKEVIRQIPSEEVIRIARTLEFEPPR